MYNLLTPCSGYSEWLNRRVRTRWHRNQGGNSRQFTVGYDGVAVGFEKGPPQAIFFLGADVASKNTISLNNQFFHQIFQQEYNFTNFRWFHAAQLSDFSSCRCALRRGAKKLSDFKSKLSDNPTILGYNCHPGWPACFYAEKRNEKAAVWRRDPTKSRGAKLGAATVAKRASVRPHDAPLRAHHSQFRAAPHVQGWPYGHVLLQTQIHSAPLNPNPKP